MKGNFQHLDMRHYRFERRCEGLYVERKSPSWAWWLAGAGVGLLLLAVLAGCDAKVGAGLRYEYPKDWRIITSPSNNKTYVVPVTMEDGTKCVVVTANGSGSGITCDWRK